MDRENILSNILSDKVEVNKKEVREDIGLRDDLVLEFSEGIKNSDMAILKSTVLDRYSIGDEDRLYQVILDFPEFSVKLGKTDLTIGKYQTLKSLFDGKLTRMYIKVNKDEGKKPLSLEVYKKLNLTKGKDEAEIISNWKEINDKYSKDMRDVGKEIDVNEEYIIGNGSRGVLSQSFNKGDIFGL